MIEVERDNKLIKQPSYKGVLMKCSNGHICSLNSYSIDNDGVVTPSVICPRTGCDFHEWVKLKGWVS